MLKKLKQSEYQNFINSSNIVVLVISRENCPNCEGLKDNIIPMVKQKLPLVNFAEFEGTTDVYPVNQLMKQFKFRTVPTSIIYVAGEPRKAIKGVTFHKEFVQEIQKLM